MNAGWKCSLCFSSVRFSIYFGLPTSSGTPCAQNKDRDAHERDWSYGVWKVCGTVWVKFPTVKFGKSQHKTHRAEAYWGSWKALQTFLLCLAFVSTRKCAWIIFWWADFFQVQVYQGFLFCFTMKFYVLYIFTSEFPLEK